MKTENPAPNDAVLSKTLQGWKVNAPLPPRFQERVWHRIAHAETQPPVSAALFSRISAALIRPSLAVGYLTILLLAGLAAGYWQAGVANARAEQALGSRYVQMVAPYQNAHH